MIESSDDLCTSTQHGDSFGNNIDTDSAFCINTTAMVVINTIQSPT